MCWFSCKFRCYPTYCASCNPRMVYLPIPRTPASAAYVNPNSPYSVYTTGPPLSAWTSPRTTVLQYANGRLQFDDNGRYPSHNPYYASWPYLGWYPPAGSGWGSSC
ncbi:hypothetical protein C8F04DRAFT_1392963 [Mycena alexandri]|uniref:Uncharacterized protein n=1 Tax=Mycena alexandri TaxID=1745969 RepID=A0AAD6T6U4_9AGAR|nr:hypothetical protein C8F04DRAFT_1392963 [Mycena alexandri]